RSCPETSAHQPAATWRQSLPACSPSSALRSSFEPKIISSGWTTSSGVDHPLPAPMPMSSALALPTRPQPSLPPQNNDRREARIASGPTAIYRTQEVQFDLRNSQEMGGKLHGSAVQQEHPVC